MTIAAATATKNWEINSSETLALLGLFALGLTSLVTFQGVGTLYALDLLLAGLAAWFVLRGARPIARTTWWLLALALVWLLGAVFTDVVRTTPPENYIRGWSKIAVFMLAIFALAQMSWGRPSRLVAFLLGLATATCAQALLFPQGHQVAYPWKFGFATPLALLSVVLASLPFGGKPPSFLRQVGLPLIMAMANLALNFRSLFVVLLAVAGITAIMHIARRISPGRNIVNPVSALALLGIAILGAWGVSEGYSRLASSGALGQDARSKHEMQTQGDLGLLLGGRTESLASVQAILDSPFLGHGSWAEDRHYVQLMLLEMRERGREAVGGVRRSALIPSHSFFLGAWVEAGIAGALFWGTAFLLSLIALLRLIDIRSQWTPLFAFSVIQLLWAIPFSPFGADQRFVVAAQVLIVAFVISFRHQTHTSLAVDRRRLARSNGFSR